jgi:phosphoenolpyruvate-protein kinase (PTS system EI component)
MSTDFYREANPFSEVVIAPRVEFEEPETTNFERQYRNAEGNLKLGLQQLRAQMQRLEDQLNSDGNVDEDTILRQNLFMTADALAVWRHFRSVALYELENAKRAQVEREIEEFNSIDEFVW